jgi:Ion channel
MLPWTVHAVVTLVTTAVVVTCVVLHYEALTWLTGFLKRARGVPRQRILLLIFAILAMHVVEIWIFGGAYFWMIADAQRGSLVAAYPIQLLDCVYFSAVCFTTLGLGDIVPTGAIRFMSGTEAVCGFVLIAWSGSFTFVEMQRFWRD